MWEFGRVLKGAKKTNMSAKEKALLEQALKNPNGMRQIKQIVERNPDILRQKGRGLVHRLAAAGPPSLLDWIVQKGGAPVASAACFAAASGNVNTFAVRGLLLPLSSRDHNLSLSLFHDHDRIIPWKCHNVRRKKLSE